MRLRFLPPTLIALCLLPLLFFAPTARAVVGASDDGSDLGRHIVMVLKGDKGRAAFCSGVVLRQNVVLTAAHCVGDPAHTMVHFRDASGGPILRPVGRIALNPDYHAGAVHTRERSIDLALIELVDDLPPSFAPSDLATTGAAAPGRPFRIAGYGLTREGDPRSGGQLRAATLSLREPVSEILLWLEDSAHAGTGACTGDSGGPIFDAEGETVVGIVDWTGGTPPNKCGTLTQGAKIGPQRGWIDRILSAWQSQ